MLMGRSADIHKTLQSFIYYNTWQIYQGPDVFILADRSKLEEDIKSLLLFTYRRGFGAIGTVISYVSCTFNFMQLMPLCRVMCALG
jgi:hypothetical protein